MNIQELFQFANWMLQFVQPAQSQYQQLLKVLEHNASQPQKQPVAEHFASLKDQLAMIPTQQLTVQLRQYLEDQEVLGLIGRAGARFVDEVIRDERFDPATAANEIKQAHRQVSVALEQAKAIREAISPLIEQETALPSEEAKGGMEVRLHFQNNASISTITDWKKWSDEWATIVQGVAQAVDEAPEDTRVIGASNGSLILFLYGSAAFVSVLVVIVTGACRVTERVVYVLNQMEEFRHRRVMNKQIEDAMKAQVEELRTQGQNEILDELKQLIGPEKFKGLQGLLKQAVKKYLDFYEKGGDVDFVAPLLDTADDQVDDEHSEQLKLVQEQVRELRDLKEDLKLLGGGTDHPEDDEADEDGVDV